MVSGKNKKKRASIERPSSTSSSVVELPQGQEDSSDSTSDDETTEPPQSSAAPRSRNDSSSSSSSDSEFDGMTCAEIMATVYPIPKFKGVPLQHRIWITTANRETIRKSGVILDENLFSFTKSEDDLIRKNWEEFAKRQKFTGHIFDFLGWDKDGLVQKKDSKLASHHTLKKVLWPNLCQGLDRRFAKTVNLRISYIFHKHFREEEDYDLEEVKRRLDNDETFPEISENLKIPPRWLERKFPKAPIKETQLCLGPNRSFFLKLLHECVIENGNQKFSDKNFNWKMFRNKCREASVDPPSNKTVNETYRMKFHTLEKDIFQYLDPKPTLKQKLSYLHEATQRYLMQNKRNRKRETPFIRLDVLLTVIFEDYNKHGPWDPPPALKALADCKKIDLEKVRSRVEVVKEQRKRLSEASPKARFHVVVKKRLKTEDLDLSSTSLNMTKEDERLEISSIQNDSSLAPSIAPSIDPFANSEDDPLTELEMSSINNTSSFAASRNETILAAGGGAGNALNNTSLGGLNQSQPSVKVEEAVSLDMSQDIWAQLVAN